jgi:membrane protein
MAKHLFTLSGYSVIEIGKRTWAEILEDDVFGRAAELAYYFFLALFPFLIFVVAGLSVFGEADRGRALLFQFGGSALPAPAFEVITEVFNDIVHSSGPVKMSFGIAGALWAASAGMTAVMDTLNAAYDVKESRSALRRYSIAIAITLGLGFLLVISMVILVMGNGMVGALSTRGIVTGAWKIIEWPIGLALAFLGFAIIYYFAPDLRHPEWHWITPGAVAGLLLWILVTAALRVYLHFFDSFSYTYGSLAGVIVLLLWFYLSGIAVLSGGAMNTTLEQCAALPASVRQPHTAHSKAA